MPKFTKIYQALNENRTFWNDYVEVEIPLTNFTQDLNDDECLEYYPSGLSFLLIKTLYEKYLPNIELNTTLTPKFIHELMNVRKPYFFTRKSQIIIQKENKFSAGDLVEEKRMMLNELLIVLFKDQVLNKNHRFQKNHTILLDSVDADSFIAISFSPGSKISISHQLQQRKIVTKSQIVISINPRMHCTKSSGFLEKTIIK